MRDIKDELKAAIDAFNFQPGSMVYEAYNEIISLRHKVSPASGGLEAVREAKTALELVRAIIVEAALTGFNCHTGDWAERLYASQADTHAAVKCCIAALAAPVTPAAGERGFPFCSCAKKGICAHAAKEAEE